MNSRASISFVSLVNVFDIESRYLKFLSEPKCVSFDRSDVREEKSGVPERMSGEGFK